MNPREAFKFVEDLLLREGREDVLVEVTRAFGGLSSAEARGEPASMLSRVTRALLEGEETYRLVFSHELDPMSLFDPATGAILDVNDSWVSLYGYAREEALTMKVTDVSAEPANTIEAVHRAAASGVSTRVAVRWHKSKDGTVFPVELTCGKLVLGERDVTYAVMRDITQRYQAEQALARSEASFRALIESMPDGVMVHRHGKVLYMSPSARRMLGYTLDEDVAGRPAIELVHADDREKSLAHVSAVAHDSAVPLVEQRLARRDGTYVVTEIGGLRTVFDGKIAMLAIARDVSTRKEYEAHLVMNDRLASLGRLSASIGHELNNPLAYVLGNLGFMERDLASASGVPQDFVDRFRLYVDIVGEGARRMRDIVRDLKTLARGDGDGRSSLVDVQQMLDMCSNMAAHELRPRTRFVKDYRDPVSVFGTEPRLGQVFLNLLVNAAQAIPEGNADDNEVRLVVRAEGETAIVEISDTGTGIPREQVDRIFEPFFTTKEGAGTGLGLSISHRIVTSAGGTLTCEPRAGGGTTFRVTLPIRASLRTP